MDDRTPVLIGAGQFTYRGEPGASPSPTALLKIAAERAALDAGLKAELQQIFGSPEPGEAGLKFVREAMEKTGARDKVREYMKCFAMEASDRIASLPQESGSCTAAAREAFHDLFRYSVERRS